MPEDEGAWAVLYLLADTSVWLDLAKNVSGEQLIAACRVLVHQGRMQLLVPKVVVDEFERNRDRVEADMTRSVTSTFRRVRTAVNEHGRGDGREETLKHLDDLTHRMPLLNQMAIHQFSEILELLRAGRSLEPTHEVHQRVIQRGLDKRAPFHRSKNSIADALLIEMYGEVLAADATSADEYCFVTTNIKDFSLPDGDTRQPHADIAGFFNPRSHYFTSLATALTVHFPDETDDLLAELDYHEEPRSLGEITPLLDKLWDQIWYNRHKNLEYQIEVGEVELVDQYRPEEHQRTVVRSIWERAQAAARAMEERYGPDELGPWDDFQSGMLSGKMSALRWVLGEDWETTLDT
jgi:PIN domain